MSGGNHGSGDVPKSEIVPGAVGMTQDQFHFLQGHSFTQSQRHTFGLDETKYFLIDPTAFNVPANRDPSQELGRVIAEVPSFFAAAGPLEINFYELVTLAPAVATPLTLPLFNRVSTSPIVAQTVLSSLDVAPGASTQFSEILVPSNALGAGQQVGFSVSESLPFALDLTKKIVVSVKNNDGAGTLVAIRWTLFEI